MRFKQHLNDPCEPLYPRATMRFHRIAITMAAHLRGLHVVTHIVVSLAVVLFVVLNIPGQVVLDANLAESDKYGEPFWGNLYATREHGWPLMYARREPVYPNGPWSYRLSLWRVTEGVKEFRPLPLLLDVGIAVVGLFLIGMLCERRLRTARRMQISLASALFVISVIAVACGLYAIPRWRHGEETRIVQMVMSTPDESDEWLTSVQWSSGGPSWIRELFGDQHCRMFDRVLVIEADGSEISHVAKLRQLKVLNISGDVSNRQLKMLERLPYLETLDLSWANLTDGPREGYILPELRSLRGVNVCQTRFFGGGLERTPNLEVLGANSTGVGDDAMEKIGRLSQLKILLLDGTDVSDTGLRHLRSLEHLERLTLASNGDGITDKGIEYLAELQSLRELNLVGCGEVTDESIPVLGRLQRLERLDLSFTRVSADGLKKLQRLLPKCDVYK